MTVAIRYHPPTRPVTARLAPADTADAVYELADAGAWASVALGAYSLELRGHCLMELMQACESLIDALVTGATDGTDKLLRTRLPLPDPDAQLHSWLFPCLVSSIPAVIFATTGDETCIFTRTLADSREAGLIALDGRDRHDGIRVSTAQLDAEARSFLATLLADARSAFPGAAAEGAGENSASHRRGRLADSRRPSDPSTDRHR